MDHHAVRQLADACRGLLPQLRSALLVLALLASAHAWSWGDTGHRIVCEIAFQELTPAARATVKHLIRLDNEFSRFNDSCIWPDHPRQRSTEHYANYPRSTRKITSEDCLTADLCILTAIATDLAILKQPAATDAAKLASLKFLGHWVGDIHQPLHLSFQDDRGGNDVVDGCDECERNLHGVWDTTIIHEQLMAPPYSPRRARHLGARLQAQVTQEQRQAWTSQPVHAWANESLQIAIAPATAYCHQRHDACIYDLATNRETYTRGEQRRSVLVDTAYLQTHAPAVTGRLVRAGVRLGALLNTALQAPAATQSRYGQPAQ
jgi:hypothetical protein